MCYKKAISDIAISVFDLLRAISCDLVQKYKAIFDFFLRNIIIAQVKAKQKINGILRNRSGQNF